MSAWIVRASDGRLQRKARRCILRAMLPRDAGAVRDALMRALMANVSGRDQKMICPESPFTSKSSVSRLWVKEGLKKVERLYSVLDGSASLKGAVLALYPDAVTQRCLIHKERNIRDISQSGIIQNFPVISRGFATRRDRRRQGRYTGSSMRSWL